MSLYSQNYSMVLKKNFMLVIIASVLLFFTFFIWAGVPVFIIGNFISELTSNLPIIYLCISISGGFLFSLFFVPINLKVAKNIANIKNRSVIISFMRIEVIWILFCSLIFALIFSILIQL
ncbi:hypothetical protein JOC75_000554 [Metabacillus crassostreae]|uniref:hypothetical protein n=1 Tax=Metabacillus crassostreae TaxID=929098 RepID=UPI0019581359|nr:hypothetical protein [Metabacillus crassostreae]MBM7602584.1 hypothetical protein [Metabacillus crassostreae]